MHLKFGSIIFALVFAFIAKITFETATSYKAHAGVESDERSPASIDQSYQDHLNRR